MTTIRETVYCGQLGYRVQGTDPKGKEHIVFVGTRTLAEFVAMRINAGERMHSHNKKAVVIL